MGDLDVSVCTSALSVDNSLGNTFTGEVGKLVKQVEVLDEDGSAWTGGHGVLVVFNRSAV